MGQESSRYKVTKGFNAQVLIAKAIQYWGTGVNTLTTFVESVITDGTVCIFNATTGVSLVGSAAVGATVPIVIAVKRGGKIYKSTPFTLTSHKVTKTPYAASVLGVKTVNTAGTVVAGKEYGVVIKDTTTFNLVSQTTYRYSVIATASDTLTTLATALVNKINDATSQANITKDLVVTAAVVATDNIAITAKSVGTSFTVGLFQQAYIDWTVTDTTKPKWGQGTPAQVRAIEKEGWIFEGVTTNYTNGTGANPEEFGMPLSLVDLTDGVYDCFQIEGYVTKAGKGPINQEIDKQSIVLFVDGQNSGAPTTSALDEISTILGF
jgi:hypothetical protein